MMQGHGLVAGNFDRSKFALLPGSAVSHLRVLPVRAVFLGCRDLRIRETVVLQFVDRHLVRRDDELPVARRADRRNLLHHLREVVVGIVESRIDRQPSPVRLPRWSR